MFITFLIAGRTIGHEKKGRRTNETNKYVAVCYYLMDSLIRSENYWHEVGTGAREGAMNGKIRSNVTHSRKCAKPPRKYTL